MANKEIHSLRSAQLSRRLTEGQPGLLQMEVDTEICLEPKFFQGNIRTSLSFQLGIFHVAMKDSCKMKAAVNTVAHCLGLIPPTYQMVESCPRAQSIPMGKQVQKCLSYQRFREGAVQACLQGFT